MNWGLEVKKFMVWIIGKVERGKWKSLWFGPDPEATR